VVGALVSGAVLFLPATPAMAQVDVSPGNMELNPGDNRQVTITLSDDNDPVNNPQATISVEGDIGGEVTLRANNCQGSGTGVLDCRGNAFSSNDEERSVTVTVSAKNPSGLQPNQQRNGSISIESSNGRGNVGVRVRGPQQAASATEVTGTVTDQATGDGVPGAQVSLKDSAGNTHDATANNQGKYTIRPSGNKPIVAGQVTVTASKENFADATATGNAQAGRALTLNLRMKPTAASAEPSAPVASEQQPTTDPSGDASDVATPQNTSGEDGGPSMLSWALIGMGVLLVLLGIGAIVLLVMRRKDDTEGDDADGYGPNPQMAPAGAGAYGGDRTMVGGRSNANDQTAIVGPQQPLDEFPDPYAAPAPAPTRVGGAYSGGYDDAQAGYGPGGGDGGYGGRGEGYGNGGGYRDDRGYGAQQGGYGDEPRGGGYGGGGGYADQATGVYQGGANGSEYGANGSGYGGGANGYGGGGGAGGANGYGGGGYGGSANGGANGGGANGYGGGAGYDEGDYGRRGGGYQGQGGGYERGGDYAGDPRNGRGRSNDWPE
jgi:hypothetical protein